MRFRWISMLLVIALAGPVLAACAADEAAAPDSGTEATDATGAEPGVTPVEMAAEDPLGTLDIAPGEPIKIAYMLVVAGADQALGIDSRRGIELAIADKPEILGHPVELVGEDSACTAEGGQAAAQKLAADKTIAAVIGTSCSSEARAGAPIISDVGLTMVSSSNTAPDLTDPAKHVAGYLRTAHNDKVQGKVAAEFVVNELKLTKVATIHDGSPYSEGLVGAFEENFQMMGGQITAHEAVNPEDTDMRPVLTRIAATSPELLYFPVFTKAGGYIASQSKEVSGLTTVQGMMGADGLFSPDFLKAAGSAAEGMYLSSPDFSTFGSAYKDKFLPAHEAKYGEKPISAFHAHAYDAYMMIAAALEKVATQDAEGTHIGRQALRDALFATAGFQGLTGNLTCNEYGDCADPRIAVYRVTAENLAAEEVPTEKIYPMDGASDAGAMPEATEGSDTSGASDTSAATEASGASEPTAATTAAP